MKLVRRHKLFVIQTNASFNTMYSQLSLTVLNFVSNYQILVFYSYHINVQGLNQE